MIRQLDKLADRSCWISGDRINACIATDAHGIAEVGFHGMQPVSRNSRMLVREQGVISLSIRDESGREEPVRFSQVEWEPYSVRVDMSPWGKKMSLEVQATARAIHIAVTGAVQRCHLKATFFTEACTTMVRGERTWKTPYVRNGWLHLECRDQIRLASWLLQQGPYAGDFLIPEPMRRTIFNRNIRSGLATAADLRPEYRNADTPVYDARTWMYIGGDECAVEQTVECVRFLVPLVDSGEARPVLIIAAGSSEAGTPGRDELEEAALHTRRSFVKLAQITPRLSGEGIQELGECFGTAPGIVHSCTVRELGMTRATPGAYYWIWAWDNLVTGVESLRWGDERLAAGMVKFINTHRDVDGAIPARWTRALEPLDTPPHGALEFLLLHLAYQHALETGEPQCLMDVYPHAVEHLYRCVRLSGGTGLVRNMSFYPDHPVRFGRTEQSIVALETGSLYAFARTLENAAILLQDVHVRDDSRSLAAALEASFLQSFWDEARAFLVDSFDADTGKRNATYPLFSLIFLQTPLGIPLIRRVLPKMAGFLEQHLQSERGTSMLPTWDIRRESEEAVASWYPHWDLYLLKVLRRAGRRDGIMRWLGAAREAYRRLGYVPEFLKLDGLDSANPASWLHHGAVSNLNCLTGWYHGIVEGVIGLEFDPGGMAVLPLALPVKSIHLQGLVHRRTRWNVLVEHDGPHLSEIRIDGIAQRGTTKVPASFHDGGSHELVLRYGARPGGVCFREILNAEVLESDGNDTSCSVRIRAMGTVEFVVDRAAEIRVMLDGKPFILDEHPEGGIGTGRIHSHQTHELTIQTSR
jgi:hypothetical protein